MSLDSEVYFVQRAKACGLDDNVLAAVLEKGWRTLGGFAFSAHYSPGQGDDTVFKDAVLKPVLGETSAPGQEAALRRLFFEAYSTALQDLKARLERGDGDPPRKLPKVDRDNRVEQVRARLPGARLREEREPGASVIEFYVQNSDEGCLRYLPWNKTVSRRFELLHGRTSKQWGVNAAGFVSLRTEQEVPSQECSTLHALGQVLARRGVALEAAQLLPFETHEKWVDRLFEALEDAPADPDHYAPTSLAQASKADQELFRLLDLRASGTLARKPDGTYPLVPLFEQVLADARIGQLLQPLPRTAKAGGQNQAAGSQTQAAPSKPPPKAPKAAPKGKAKARAFNRPSTPRMPKELIGMASRGPKNENLCFSYNLSGCSDARPGESCARGLHVCCRYKAEGLPCWGKHSQRDHV
jgi:hypothetical protein